MMSTIRDQSPWFTLDEAADYMKIGPRTVQRIVAEGLLQTTDAHGKGKLIHREWIDQFLFERASQPDNTLAARNAVIRANASKIRPRATPKSKPGTRVSA